MEATPASEIENFSGISHSQPLLPLWAVPKDILNKRGSLLEKRLPYHNLT